MSEAGCDPFENCFEPENIEKMYRRRIAELEHQLAEARQTLDQIVQWSESYPIDIFPEPDFTRAAELLKAGEIEPDSVSAAVMRMALKGVGRMARTALVATAAGGRDERTT